MADFVAGPQKFLTKIIPIKAHLFNVHSQPSSALKHTLSCNVSVRFVVSLEISKTIKIKPENEYRHLYSYES